MNYLYDTNILAFIIKQEPAIEKIEKAILQDAGNLRIISIATKAEIETVAVLFMWGDYKLEQLKILYRYVNGMM